MRPFGRVELAPPSSGGNEKVVEIIGPQQSFGEAALFARRPRPVFAQAIADTLLLHIARDAILESLEADTSFARRMLAGLAMRMHALVQDVESCSSRSSAQRVIGRLLERCPPDSCAGGSELTLPTSKQITTSPSTVDSNEGMRRAQQSDRRNREKPGSWLRFNGRGGRAQASAILPSCRRRLFAGVDAGQAGGAPTDL